MAFSTPVTQLIRKRYSCRTYATDPIDEERRKALESFIADQTGPFGSPTQFELIAATEEDRETLRDLGTYGFIKNPTAFVIGAMGPGDKNLEDFGYAMERIILFATELNLGTCWLGGTFTKSRFADKISAGEGERVPAVTSVGIVQGDWPEPQDGSHRDGWEQLFFDQTFGQPLTRKNAGAYATPLEMVRLGPSASNKQPWRVVHRDSAYHFYIRRSPRYREWIVQGLLGIADMQRLDAGIAMCHFELTAREEGLDGEWQVDEPGVEKPDGRTEYIVSWKSS